MSAPSPPTCGPIIKTRDRGGDRGWLASQLSDPCPDQVTRRRGGERGAGLSPRSQVCLKDNAIQP